MSLWRDHEATPRQQRLVFGPSRKKRARPSQADVLLQLLREKRAQGKALELPEIKALGIYQHSARFSELKERGVVWENEMEHDAAGRVLSRYYLKFDPEANR